MQTAGGVDVGGEAGVIPGEISHGATLGEPRTSPGRAPALAGDEGTGRIA
jgi:hypothetical protein